MDIELLGKSLIPIITTQKERKVFELFIHGVSINNNRPAKIKLKEICYTLMKGKIVCEQRHFNKKRLAAEIYKGHSFLTRQLQMNQYALGLSFSRKFDTPNAFVGNTSISQGQKIGIIGHFFSLLDQRPSSLLVEVYFEYDGKLSFSKKAFPLREYNSKNRYIFPIKGNVACFSGPAGGCGHHRDVTSQEFGYDLLPLDDKCQLMCGKGTKNINYVGFNREVIAPSGGTIITINDGASENIKTGKTPKLTINKIKKMGFVHALSGNVVVIKHLNNEYSFMGHLANGSIRVKIGQKVKKGEIVAAIGNTGNSTAPHLHYHLMDGPDLLSARSLPVHFTNIHHIPWHETGNTNDEGQQCDLNGLVDPIIFAK